MTETFTIGVFILQRAVLSLRFSAVDSTFSHSPAASVRIPNTTPVRPRCAGLPAAACVSSDWSLGAIHTVETEATDVHYCICWVLTPPEFEVLRSGGAVN